MRGRGIVLLLVGVSVVTTSIGRAQSARRMRTAQVYEYESTSHVLQAARADPLTSQEAAMDIQKALQALKSPPPNARSLHKSGFQPRIVNGVNTAGYPSVGALLHLRPNGVMAIDCTATLVGSHSVLTAAHCVAPDRVAEHYRVYFQHAGVLTVSSVQYPREVYRYPTGDVAIVHLRDEVTGIQPIPINTAAEILTGTSGLLVGFGPTASAAGDAGIKRIGLTTTAPCDCPVGSPGTCTPPDSLVCWTFEIPTGGRADMSNTCTGDSGGPLIREIETGGRIDVVGVTSGGASETCLAPDKSFDASTFKYQHWIAREAGSDYGTTSTQLPMVGDEAVFVLADEGYLDKPHNTMTFRLNVPAQSRLLRVSMNAQDRGTGADVFNISAKPPLSSSRSSSSSCSVTDKLQFKSCAISNPAAGDWEVTVTREQGEGHFQVIGTIFGSHS